MFFSWSRIILFSEQIKPNPTQSYKKKEHITIASANKPILHQDVVIAMEKTDLNPVKRSQSKVAFLWRGYRRVLDAGGDFGRPMPRGGVWGNSRSDPLELKLGWSN